MGLQRLSSALPHRDMFGEIKDWRHMQTSYNQSAHALMPATTIVASDIFCLRRNNNAHGSESGSSLSLQYTWIRR